ncbi:MAG: alpha/beta hydrolase [Bacilli bacterium]|nr:alpha/beta hydrolase [Bacilli bacterium]
MKIKIYKDTNKKQLPVLILNSYEECGEEIYQKTKSNDYILVEISDLDWNKNLSPWYMERLWKQEEDYSGKAKEYLEEIQNSIIPNLESELKKENIEVTYYGIVGYSLAGLFALFTSYHTNCFSRIVSCSGSFWYPDFVEYCKENKISTNINKIYFSLGNREKDTKNIRMKSVEDRTKELEEYYEGFGIKATYVEEEGNHFQNTTERQIKGIEWILRD